jgi:hypothetical protein
MNCRTIEILIDEAERPDRLPLDVADHTAECPDCRRFANERLALRELLVSARVTAPPYFDTQLKARLSERLRVKQRAPWLAPAFYARAGAAAAVLVVAFVVVQNRMTDPREGSAVSSENVAKAPPVEVSPPTALASPVVESVAALPSESKADLVALPSPRRPARPQQVQVSSQLSSQLSSQPGIDRFERSVMWIRGPEREIGVPAISVGAEPMFYANAGQPVRSIQTSY